MHSSPAHNRAGTTRPQRTLYQPWGAFMLTSDDVQNFRLALEQDLGDPVLETDDEVRQMAFDTILALRALMKVARENRGIHGSSDQVPSFDESNPKL